jgi:hypothetical protein
MANSKYGKIIAIATTACVILLGVLFIACAAHLYYTGGDQPYSRERVGDYLGLLIIPSAITILLTAGGALYTALSGEKSNDIAKRSNIEFLESFRSWFDLSNISGGNAEEILKERKSRKIFSCIAYSFSALIFALIFVYLCFIAEFTVENLNADVKAAFAVVLPLSAIAVGIHVPRLYVAEVSCERELRLTKEYVKANMIPKAEESPEKVEKRENIAIIVKCAVFAVAVIFIMLGIVNGGMDDVLAKAVKICTECIGLG